jgi:DNA-binding MarR family transcriptional regulator
MLDGLPPVMWFMRREMRRHPKRGVSVPQYRVLVILDSFPSASLSAVADNLGLSLPAASRLVTGLVRKGFVARKSRPGDRRQMSLELTSRGRTVLTTVRRDTEERVASEIQHLSEEERTTVVNAMNTLRQVFGAGGRLG